MNRLLIAAALLLSTGCVTGGAERWQRTRSTRDQERVRVHESAVQVQGRRGRLEVTAYERVQTERRSLRTYQQVKEVYRAGGDLDELVYGLLWGIGYCAGIGPIYDVVSTIAGEHAFPALRTIVFGLLPGVHDATLRGLVEDHRIAAEEPTGLRMERVEGPWEPIGPVAWAPVAERELEVRCGSRLVGLATTDERGRARVHTRHECASGAWCPQLAVSVDGVALTRVYAPVWDGAPGLETAAVRRARGGELAAARR